MSHYIFVFFRFLKNLPPDTPAMLFTSPLNVIKHYLLNQKLSAHLLASSKLRRIFLIVCREGHYFSSLATFFDRQTPNPAEGTTFDTYIHQIENQDLHAFLRVPFSVSLFRAFSFLFFSKMNTNPYISFV